MKTIRTKNPEETQLFAEKFAHTVENGGIIALYGDLGFGKTTFVQGLAKGLGISKRIISPTFVMVRKYTIGRDKKKHLYHIDLYRIRNEKELYGLGLQEIFHENNAVIVIEWSERLGGLLPRNRWEIRFTYTGEHERKIYGQQYTESH